MKPLAVVGMGPLPAGLLNQVTEFLAASRLGPVRLLDDTLEIAPAFDPARRQFNCRLLFPLLEVVAAREETRILGVTDVDLFSPIFTFVFGEAKVNGNAAMFSTARLRQTFYGLPEDPALLLARARREALHETGHMLGLLHCRQPDCAMRFSAAAEEVDLKEDRLCADCRARLVEHDGSCVIRTRSADRDCKTTHPATTDMSLMRFPPCPLRCPAGGARPSALRIPQQSSWRSPLRCFSDR